MSIRIDGKQISAQIKDELKERVEKENLEVTLAVIQVGNDPASTVYVGNKKKACEYIGIRSLAYELPEETPEEELLQLIKELNDRDDVNGILVQLPLPAHMDEDQGNSDDFTEKRCRWFPSTECRCPQYRTAGICFLYTSWCNSVIKTYRGRNRWKRMCDRRTK